MSIRCIAFDQFRLIFCVDKMYYIDNMSDVKRRLRKLVLKTVKTIGIITPGGDAPGINACIRAIVRTGVSYEYKIVGIQHGYRGLFDEKIVNLYPRSVSGTINQGGTILKSTRCKEIRTSAGIKRAAEILKRNGVNCLVVIGGDGSSSAAYKLIRYGIRSIIIPASIDNDVYGTDETIGFDTAVNTAVEAIDKIRDTANSFERVFIAEVMGREHGFLALAVGVASGAEFIIVPEIKCNIPEICRHLEIDKKKGKTSEIMVFAEGAGNSQTFAEEIEKRTGIEVKVSKLGYIQRGGAPTAWSRILAGQFGAYAVDLIRKNIFNRIVVINHDKIGSIPLSKSSRGKKQLDLYLYHLAQRLAV